MRRNLTKAERIRKKSEFDAIFALGKKKEYCGIKLLYIKNDLFINRIGVIIKKGVKKAVKRNREKRLILEAYRSLKPNIVPGYDFIVLVKQTGSCYNERVHQLNYLLHLQKLLSERIA